MTVITYIDVGAAGQIEAGWKARNNLKKIKYVGFDPDRRSDSDYIDRTVHPNAVGRKKMRVTLFETRKPQVSSLLRPAHERLSKFVSSERFEVVGQTEVEVLPLDHFDIKGPNFLKIDVQGMELDVLKGARETLKQCIGLLVEVEFIQIYEGQPLFGEVSAFLSQHGFEFEDFITLRRWHRKPGGLPGQLIFGDALFLVSPSSKLDSDQKRALRLAAEVYGREEHLNQLAQEGYETKLTKLLKIRMRNRINVVAQLAAERLGLIF